MARPPGADPAAGGPAPDDAFGAALYEVLAGRPGGLVFSPAGIAAALRLALLGARGQTATELAAVLHLDSPAAAAEGLRLLGGLCATGDGDDAGLVFRAPNTVWVQAGFPLRQEFTDALATLPPAAVRGADFGGHPDQARQDINTLIGEQTAGKITGLLGQGAIGPATRLVLANAVYLKAAWAHPFPAGATRREPFRPAPGDELTVPMMHLSARFGYLRGDGYQAVTLPYRGGRLAMAVILPDGPPGAFGPVAGRLAAAGLGGLLAGAAATQVRLALPRFRLETQLGLVPVLQRLGLTQVFTADADFTGITEADRIAIDAVAHSAYIDVDEEGTEAAAATGLVLAAVAMPTGVPVEMTVDRPFLFAITDQVTGLPLFLGRVTAPSGA